MTARHGAAAVLPLCQPSTLPLRLVAAGPTQSLSIAWARFHFFPGQTQYLTRSVQTLAP